MKTQESFDIIILGAGIAGTTLAAILARHNQRVLLLEKGSLPRFAVGEAMLPATALWLWILGQQYDVPEIQVLSHVDAIREKTTQRYGVKRSFGFLYHREGRDQSPLEAQQLIPPLLPIVQEVHLFREDSDLYMLQTAMGYGAVYRDHTTVTDVAIGDDVTVVTENGERYRGRYLVDAAGFRSPLAEKFELRRGAPALRTHSRAIFTHMADVPAFDDLVADNRYPSQMSRWHEGTLHHVFDGGWFWIIPFDNHAEARTSLTSVGLMLDTRRHPRSALSPQAEFEQFVQRFPTVARQLAGATPVRDCMGTDRIQYAARRSIGSRYALLSHSHGFVDPLYSNGLVSTFESIHALADRLLGALAEDDFNAARFLYLDTMQRAQIERNDRLVHNAYRSMAHFSLWNAWTHVWLANILFSEFWLVRCCLKYLASGDRAYLSNLDATPRPGAEAPFAPMLDATLAFVESQLDRVAAGELNQGEAAGQIYRHLDEQTWLPHHIFGWGRAGERHVDFTPVEAFHRLVAWGQSAAPAAMREGMFDLPVPA